MPDSTFDIRACSLSDIDSISHLQPKDWDDIVSFFKFYCEAPFCYPVVGIAGKRIAGLGSAIVNGPTGWIAHIIVDEEYRRRGFGRLMTGHCIDELEQRGCTSKLLIATALGEPLYRKMGFTTVSTYHFYRGPKLNAPAADSHIRRLSERDRERLFNLDRELTGETRRHVIERLGFGGWGYFEERSGELRGFFLPEAGDGAIVARDAKAGVALLALKHSRRPCKTVLPAENREGNRFLSDNGFKRYLEAPRMLLGDPVNWNPRALFCRIGGWYG